MKFHKYTPNHYHNEISTSVNGQAPAVDDNKSHRNFHSTRRLHFALCGFLVLSCVIFLPQLTLHVYGDDEQTPSDSVQPNPANDLVGMWILVGEADKKISPKQGNIRMKFFSKKNWSVTQINPETGDVVYHHGGTYSLVGDDYTETVEYANKNTKNLVSQTGKFKVKIVGDRLTLIGIGNPFTEIWKRGD